MDVIIPGPDKLKVISHNQYNPSESLSPSTILPNPLDQFLLWFTQVQGLVKEPESMSLSTSTLSGTPSSRFVLFKQLDKKGFLFFTNYNSRKSKELIENPKAALGFYWREVHRQVRVVGRVERVEREESEEYFKTRPVGSRLGAWASNQSSVVKEDEVKEKLEEVKKKFGIADENQAEGDVPLPEFWGGWRVIPDEVEFWLGKPSRLHDRIRYLRVEGSPDDAPQWKIDLLAP
ncbi:pyridoxamine 5'-phosphate oxidase [Abortiporus biennis]|nr:pyridoxamine 5'-phosphate oxidase [Abortiporus biennis]